MNLEPQRKLYLHSVETNFVIIYIFLFYPNCIRSKYNRKMDVARIRNTSGRLYTYARYGAYITLHSSSLFLHLNEHPILDFPLGYLILQSSYSRLS